MVKQTIAKKYIIDGKYTVQFFVKKGAYAESYRVKDHKGDNYFLKLFPLAKLHRTQFDNLGNIKEIEFLKSIKHPNIVNYVDNGELIYQNQSFAYLVMDYISGETLAEKLSREQVLSWYSVRRIVIGVLNGLKYMHSQPHSIIHNDITPLNVMLDMKGSIEIPKIIDFGYARFFSSSTKVYYRKGLNPFYLAPECFNNVFSAQSDLFSVGALMYQLLYGIPPWFIDISDYQLDTTEMEDRILDERKKPLKRILLDSISTESNDLSEVFEIIRRALSANVDYRFQSADEMIKVISGEEKLKSFRETSQITPSVKKAKASNKGFNAIAGMEQLKETLYQDVIRALEEKELYKEYGIPIPNGILLYGPPGCGKSFFAEKLAEEVSYNYIEVKPSSLASIYVHGSQEKIGKLFEDAKNNAPSIINFEEFDALVPRRDSHAGNHQSGEVNEFLTQLNNCGENGIFVIASTNQLGLIDDAILRAGRIDKIFYVPPPDQTARKEMFRLYLQNRPVELGIDYDSLAINTEYYVSVDIKQIVNQAARDALKNNVKISQEILLNTIKSTRPSVNKEIILKYEKMRDSFEGNESTKPIKNIGFDIK